MSRFFGLLIVGLFALPHAHADELLKSIKLGSTPQYTLGSYWVAISRDGKQLAYRTAGDTISIFDPVSNKLIREIKIEEKQIGEQLFFTSDGKQLVFHAMANLHFLDSTTGKLIRSMTNWEFSPPHEFKWSEDGSVAISADNDYFFDHIPKQIFWNAKGQLAGAEKVEVTGRRCQTISGDGKLVATGANYHKKAKETDEPLEEYITLWDFETRKPSARIHLGKGINSSFLSLNRDGKYLIAYTTSKEGMELWNVKAAKKIAGLGKIPEGRFRCTYSADDKKVAIQTNNGYVGVFETSTGKKLLEKQFSGLGWGLFTNSPAGVGFLENGDVLACYGSGNRALVKNISQKVEEPEPKIVGHTERVIFTYWSADGKSLMTVGLDKQILRWDTTTGKLLETVIAEEPRPGTWWQNPVVISADSKWLIVDTAGRPKFFNMETKKEVCYFTYTDKKYYPHWKGFAFSEDGKKVFAYGEAQESNNNFKIIIHAGAACWNTETGEQISEFFNNAHRDGKKIFDANYGKEKLMVNKAAEKLPEIQMGASIRDPWASGTNAGPLMMGNKITMIDQASKKVILETTLATTGQGISLSPDGKRIALPMADKTVWILDLPSMK